MTERTTKLLSQILLGLLILLGGYTFLYYLGMPVHRASLLLDADSTWVDGQCSFTACQGFMAIFPMLKLLAIRLGPLAAYCIISLLAGAGFVFFQQSRQRTWNILVRVRPLYIGGAFIVSLWLLATMFSFTSPDGAPFRQIVEPNASVYRDVAPNALTALQESFKGLKDGNCLTLAGYAADNVAVYNMSQVCFQKAIFTRVIPQVLVAAGFLFELLVLGHAILSLLRRRPTKLFLEGMASVGLGVSVWIALLWLVSVRGIYEANVGWLLVLCVPILCFRSVWYWVRTFWTYTWEVNLHPKNLVLPLAWFLVSYLALNFLVVVRPFPIGWDDLGSYLNRPRLLVSYGHFIPSMSSFQWEYLTSLGFLLFGYTSTFGATASMIINWTEGLIAVCTVLLFGQMLFGKGRGLLATLVFYTLPLIGHFSFADMKIDNAVFFMASLALLMMFMGLFPTRDEIKEGEEYAPQTVSQLWIWFLLAGVFGGIAFGMKSTALMVLMAMVGVFVGVRIHPLASVGTVFAAFTAFAFQGALPTAKIVARLSNGMIMLPQSVFVYSLALMAIIFFAIALWRAQRETLLPTAKLFGFFLLGFVLSAEPWMFYNGALTGRYVPGLYLTAPNTLSPNISLESPVNPAPGVHSLPQDLKLDMNHPNCKSTGSTEELDRYWGNGKGPWHYLSLPWRSVMNIDIGGYYVTTVPVLLLFPLVLLLPFFWKKREGRALRYLAFSTGFIVVEWIFLANGIPWYGVGMFLGLALCMEALVAFAPNRSTRIAAATCVGLSLMLALGMRMWQFEMQHNLIEYPLGKISANALEQRTIPWYGMISQIVTQRHTQLPEQPYLYRVGTFIPYFIPKSLEVTGLADHQLDNFNCLNQERNPQLTLKRLVALGFNSIIFDTNTATIESDPQGTLHQKVNHFIEFVNTPNLGLKILVSDLQAGVAYVLLPPN